MVARPLLTSSAATHCQACARHGSASQQALWQERLLASAVGRCRALPLDIVRCVRCPFCSSLDDKVVDSRVTEDALAIRRRRECMACGLRFTTFERQEDVPLSVIKRSGQREPFDRSKIVAGLRAAGKNRPLAADDMEAIAAEVEEEARAGGTEVTSESLGLAVLSRLHGKDEVAYLRFASVYKGFEDLEDFRREVVILTKETAPKRRGAKD